MKVIDRLKHHFTVSFEYFPPKTPEGEKDLMQTVKSLEAYDPDFVSVTYGAGGSTRDKTREIVERIFTEEKLNVMAHLTCVGHTRTEIVEIVDNYRKAGIENILALRGDCPAGSNIDPNQGELPHAIDLIRLIRENHGNHFSIGGAAFPEKHPESPDWQTDIRRFAEKAAAGMEFGVTQLFFDNRFYFELLDRLEKAHVRIPVIPGIMPITSFGQIDKFAKMCHTYIPEGLRAQMTRYEHEPESVMKLGIEYAVTQCESLIGQGVSGLHFYTLNKSKASQEIVSALGGVLPVRS